MTDTNETDSDIPAATTNGPRKGTLKNATRPAKAAIRIGTCRKSRSAMTTQAATIPSGIAAPMKMILSGP